MNKTITYICLTIISYGFGNAQEIRTEVLRSNSVITVSAGEKIECISAEAQYSYSSYDGGYGYSLYKGPRIKITKDSAEFIYAVSPINIAAYGNVIYIGATLLPSSGILLPLSSWVSSGDGSNLVLDGPVVISYQNFSSNGESILFTYKKYSSVSSNSISATSVVIPSSAAGDVDVKMEQSADNVTWTECLPGTYNSSTVKRFFRLRAVEK
jgi:hypothetical protein